MRDFFSELKRRRVYKVAVIYAAVAWVMVQIADVILDNFIASERAMQGIILLTVLGFPVALVLAWVYDITPEGIKRTPLVEKNGSTSSDDQ